MLSRTVYFLDPSAKYSSCEVALAINNYREDNYKIKYGDKKQLISVECKVNDGATYALVHHDSESPSLVTGYEPPGTHR